MVVPDPLRFALGLLFMLTGGFAILGRIWLFGRMKEHVPGLSLFFSTTFFYLEVQYWRNRKELRGRGLGLPAALVFVSPLVFVGAFLALFLTRG